MNLINGYDAIFTIYYLQAFQIANLIREYTEVLTQAAEEQAKEFATQGELRQHQLQQLQHSQLQQIANNQMRFHQMQQAKNGQNNITQNQAHFRHAQTQLVPPQPS